MKTHRVGIIGAGKIFPMHAYSILGLDGVELVAVCDNKPDLAVSQAKRVGALAYTDYNEMFRQANLDTVHICTPHHLHPEMGIAAANAGIHVVCEKPAAIVYEDVLKMEEAKLKNNTNLMISFQNRFNPGSIAIKKIMEEKKLGDVLSARANLRWNRSDHYYDGSDWKGTWDMEGGGVLIDQAIHTLDLMHWFLDKEIKEIDVTMGRRGHTIIQVEDYVEGIIRYEDDVLAAINFLNHYAYDAPVEIEIVCEKGRVSLIGDEARIDYLNGCLDVIGRNPNDKFEVEGVKGYWGVGHKAQIKYYYEQVLSGKTPILNDISQVKETQYMVAEMYRMGRANSTTL